MPRKRSKPIPYTGIAALITAVGGVVVGFYTMDQKKADSDLTAESVLNFSKSLETRVAVLEKICTARPMHFAKPPECQMDAECQPGYLCKDGHCISAATNYTSLHGDSMTIEHDVSAPVRHKPEPTFKAIQQFIKKNKAPATF